MAPATAYRAVIVWGYPGSNRTHTEYQGPYWRQSDAQGRVTRARRSRGYGHVVSAHVEAAQLGQWAPTEEA